MRPAGAKQYFFHGDPLVTADMVIVGADVSGEGLAAGIHAFDRAIGREVWRHTTGRGVGAAVIKAGERLLAPTYDGEFVALHAPSGKKLWAFPFKPPGFEGAAVAGDRLFAAGADGSVLAVEWATGRVVWQRALGAGTTTSVVVGVGAKDVYVGVRDGFVHRLDSASGARLSALKPDDRLMPAGLPNVTQADSLVVLLADPGMDYRALVSMDAGLRRVQWRRDAGDRWSTSRVFVWKNAIVTGAPSGEVTAYCVGDGSVAWTHTVKGTVRSVGGADDALYVGTREGTLYALAAPAGSCR